MKKIVSLVIILILVLIVLCGCIEVNENTTEERKIEVVECEHDWVITSKYDWFFSQYKTISKCSKCGKEI